MTQAPQREGAAGNPEVIDLLETWLRRAKQGKINHACIIVCQDPNLAACDFAGSVEMGPVVKSAIKQLERQVELGLSNRELPKHNSNLGADHVCYDLATGPLTYDFFTWLVEAEMVRVREDAPYPLKVHFFKGKDGKLGLEGHRTILFEKVVLASMKLLGAIESATPGGSTKLTYGMQNIIALAKEGNAVPILTPSEDARKIIASKFQEPFVTITLREASRWQHRNSNVEAWVRFASDLRADGKRVVFVRDTERADEKLPGEETYTEASIEIDIRTALYEKSDCNFFVSNGPVGLAYYGNRPWAMFVSLYETDRYKQGTPKGFKASMGLDVEEQLPWSKPYQRIVYAEDSYENLSATWELLKTSMKEHNVG